MVETKGAVEAAERRDKMEGQAVLAMALVAPVILMPVAFVGYLTIGGIYAAVRRTPRAARPAAC